MKQITPFSEKRQSLIKKLEEDRNKSRTQRIKATRADKKARSARKEKHNLILKELQTSFFNAEEKIRLEDLANEGIAPGEEDDE